MINIYNQQNNNRENGGVASTPPKTMHADISKYQDPTGEFTSSEFKWSFWFVKHKILLYKLSVGFLIVFSVIFGGYALLNLAVYFSSGLFADINLQKQLTVFPDYTLISAQYAPKPVQVEGVNILNGGSNSFDLVAQVVNPNKNFVVYFDYYFNVGDKRTAIQHSFLLPLERRPVTSFGFKDGYPSDVNLVLENVSWKRLRAQNIKNPADYQAERLNFIVSDFVFTSEALSGGLGSNIVNFNLRNDSAYGYRDAQFVIGLMQSGALSAVMPLLLQDFKSGESRVVDLRNFVSNLPVDNVEIFPIIDIYNKDVYLAPQE
jgi:hypothetical protein